MNEQYYLRKKFVTLVIALVGLIGLIYGFFEYQTANNSLNWPTTTGRVYKSEVERTDLDHDGTFKYEAVIRYTFQVNHRTYKSSRVYFGSLFELNSPDYQNELVAKFPVNSTPTVYFQRNNPNEAVLEPGTNNSVYAILVISFLLLFGGVAGTIYLVKKENSYTTGASDYMPT